MKKLAIVVTHPIQYYVPVFRLLAKQCFLKVFYSWGADGINAKYDPGFGKTIAWNVPLLDGYDYELLENMAKVPGSHHGKGIINPDIVTKIKAFSPNAILVYGYIYHSHFKLMRHFKGKIPIWFRGDSTLLDKENPVKSIIKKYFLKWMYSHVDKAFYVGTNNKAYFKKYGLKENQLIFCPHAVDNERFSEDRKKEVAELRESLGVDNDSILILFAGKLEHKKNPDLLLKALKKLVTRQKEKLQSKINQDEADLSCKKSKIEIPHAITSIHLLFVGNGVLENNLKVQSSNLASQIHFIDFQNQMQIPMFYQACDIFCLPSQGPGETWGLAVNEAMAASKAIIVSDKVGCAIDLVQKGKNGEIFRSESIDGLVNAIQLLAKDKKILQDYGQESFQIIQNWSFEKQAEAIIYKLNEL